jgi:hypothetical protein
MTNFSNPDDNLINAQKQLIESYKKYSAATNASTGLEIYESDTFDFPIGIEEITDNVTVQDTLPGPNILSGINEDLWYIVLCDSPITIEKVIKDNLETSGVSPFDRIDDFADDDKKLTEIIDYIRSQTNISFGQQLANRLEFLVEIAKEEEPEETPIIPESLGYFINLVHSFPNLKYPDVMISPSRNIRVQWQASFNRHFAVEFIEDGDVRFVVFSPNPENPEKTTRLSGITSLDSLLEIAKPYGVLAWSSQ